MVSGFMICRVFRALILNDPEISRFDLPVAVTGESAKEEYAMQTPKSSIVRFIVSLIINRLFVLALVVVLAWLGILTPELVVIILEHVGSSA